MLISGEAINSRIKLIEKLKNGQTAEYPLDILSIIRAQPGADYSVIDEDTGEIPEGTVLRREGDMLVIDINDETMAKIDDYYDDEGAGFIVPNASETGEVVLAGGEAANVADGAIVWPTAAESGGISPWIWIGGGVALAAGAGLAAGGSGGGGGGGGSTDTTAPTLESSSPADDAVSVAVDGNITLTFSEDIALGSAGTITLVSDTDSSDTITIDVANHDGQLSVDGNTLTVNPGSNLADDSSYHVEISAGAIEDAAGNDYAGIADATTLNFVTTAPADTTAPTLGSSLPADNATSVAVDSDITLTFSEDIALGSAGTITLISDTNSSDTITIDVGSHGGQLSVTGKTLTINPGSDLADGSNYHVEISEGAIEDAAGNDYAGIADATTLNFETADITAPTLSSSSPADDATGVAADSNITLTFNENIALGSSGFITLVNDDASAEVQIDVSNHGGQLSVSGDTLTINPTSDLASLSNYHVEIDSGAIEDASGNDYAGISDAAMLNFVTADADAPTLSSSSPSDNDTNVAVGSDITLTFNENIVLGSAGYITLVNDDTSTEVQIDVTSHGGQLSVAGNTLTINPTGDMASESNYHVEIDNGAIVDQEGNSYAGIADAATLNFVTADATAPSYVSSATTTAGTNGVALDSNITITFDEDIDLGDSGTITLVNEDDNSKNITIDVSSHGGQLSISDETLTINPTAELDHADTYHVEISNGAIEDTAGNAFAGISNPATVTFDTDYDDTVVFDLVNGVNSSHSGRTFDEDVEYTIYIRVDSDSYVLNTTSNLSGVPATSWGVWAGGDNLGSNDTVILVGNDAVNDVVGRFNSTVTNYSYDMVAPRWWTSGERTPTSTMSAMYARAASLYKYTYNAARSVIFARTVNSTNSYAAVWTGHWEERPASVATSLPNPNAPNYGLTLNQVYLKTMPTGILTSQGLAP